MNRFLAQAKEAGTAVKVLGTEAELAGKKMQTAGTRGFWMSQAMFTLRRTMYHATLGVGVLGAAALVMGFQFDNSMELATKAFTRFLGSPEAARKELDYLYDLARLTPFEFPQLTDATRKFLAFGFSIDESNHLLTDLGDAIASFGGGTEEINRAVIALGQIRSTGRLLGQDLRQLQQLGLVDPADLQKRLNLAPGWLSNVGAQNISSKRAIDAITAYWRDKFGGASADFAKTMMGRLTTVRDDLRKAFGLMFEPLYVGLRDRVLPLIDRIAFAMQEGFQAGGFRGMFEALDKANIGGGNLADTFDHLAMVARPLWLVIKDVVAILGVAWRTILPLGAVFIVLVPLLWGLHGVLSALKYPLGILLGLFIIERSVLMLMIITTKSFVFWRMAVWLWTRNVAIAEMFYTLWVLRSEYATLLLRKATVLLWLAQLGLAWAARFLTAAFIGLNIAMYTNPVGLIVVGIVALGVAFAVLYWKVKWFHDLINKVWETMKKMVHWVNNNPITKWGKYLIPGLNLAFAGLDIATAVSDNKDSIIKTGKGIATGGSMTSFQSQEQAFAMGGDGKKKGPMVQTPINLQVDGKILAEVVAEQELRLQGRG